MNREEPFLKEKARLLELLQKDGIYYGTAERPVLSRDGTTGRWMLDSLCVSLTCEGINLAGRCLLKLLEGFSGRTLATYGTIGIPLLTSCVLQSDGRYQGLLVRKEIKAYGSRKLLEGPINKDEPVIIVDDSVSSGTNMMECRKKLEEAGFRVEGGVCLVRFGWYAGFARMQELGYHMEALYDIWEDFMYHMENEPDPIPNPTKIYTAITWHNKAALEGLHPAHLARQIMDEYLCSGKLLTPPKKMDREYDGAGGIWVSVRSKKNIYLRHAREGMWHFPGEDYGPTGKDLALAALKTAVKLAPGDSGRKQLEKSAVAVTFFSAMEECTVGELDNDRYGIVVRSRERPIKMGGALPAMPGISNAWMQFQHARRKNAGLVSFEPFQLLRHDVVKVVEPGVTWQPTGVPKPDTLEWNRDEQLAGKVTARAFDLVSANFRGTSPTTQPLPEDFLADKLDSLFVSVYLDGQLRGCMGSAIKQLDSNLQELCQRALTDDRFEAGPDSDGDVEHVAVTVSFLWNPLDLGNFSPEDVMLRVRFGQQALMAHQGKRSGLLLPFVAATFNLNPVGYALEVIDKAGITRPPYYWRRFECRTWLAGDNKDPQIMVGMFPAVSPPTSPDEFLPRFAQLLSGYLLKRQREDGSLFFRYFPFKDALVEKIDLPRMAHGCWIMTRAGQQWNHQQLQDAAGKLTAYLMGYLRSEEKKESQNQVWLWDKKNPPSVSGTGFLLLAISEAPHRETYREIAPDIAETLWSRIDNHGKIHIFQDPTIDDSLFQDYSPGQLLLALANACAAGLSDINKKKLDRAFDFYRHRFRYKRDFGQVSWMMQAFTAWWFITREPEHAAFVFEIARWILEFQDRKEGGFLNDHQSDTPGYTTALYLEGLGAAARLAEAGGDSDQAEHLRSACFKGFSFLDRLIIQERDIPILPNPPWALGGLRASIHSGEVRTDFVQHALSALLELLPAAANQTLLQH